MKFSHSYWLGLFIGLELRAEAIENSNDINEMRRFLEMYRKTVSGFKAAHSEHMEESLKNAGIGRETKGIV